MAEIEAKSRTKSMTKLFHDTTQRQNSTLFRDQTIKILKKSQSKEAIKVSHDPFGKISKLSGKFHKPINFQEALTYPLCSVPLNLVFPDGTKRCTS